MNSLIHIKEVAYCPCSELSGMKFLGSSICKIPQNVNFTKINNLVGLAAVKMEDEVKNRQRIYSITLTFQVACKRVVPLKHQSFLLTTVSGERLLVGTDARPYPIIKESNPYPDKPGDSVLKTVTVSWNTLHPMLAIV